MKENNHKKHLIKAYLDDSEYEKFISIAKATKRSNSRVVRDMLDNAIFVEYPPVEYGQVLRELRRIGINLNQISERAHSLNHIDSNAYRIDKNHFHWMRINLLTNSFVCDNIALMNLFVLSF